ncbi:hypothetical protein ACPW7J_09350 [Ihubacter sp. rT4E-8]|uniref:hypothetical protein n=1 Tax=Ihubacter sp. rT4E-8 TaxID=3242369 RepID=UPI003CE68B59
MKGSAIVLSLTMILSTHSGVFAAESGCETVLADVRSDVFIAEGDQTDFLISEIRSGNIVLDSENRFSISFPKVSDKEKGIIGTSRFENLIDKYTVAIARVTEAKPYIDIYDIMI